MKTALARAPLTFNEYSRRFALPMWRWYAGGFLLLAAVNVVNLAIPQLAKQVINKLTENGGAGLSSTRDVALAVIGLGLLMIVIRSLSRIVIFWPGRRLETSTKSFLFDKVLRLPESFFLTHGMGDLISRLSNDVGQLRAFYAFGLLQALNVIFLLVFTIAKMVTVHPTLTFLALAPLALMFGIMRITMPRMHHYSRANQKAMGALTNRVTEAFVNVHVIQANAAEAAFTARAGIENEQVYATNMRMVYIRMAVFPLMSCLSGVAQLVVLFYGGHEVMAGRLSVGDILAFNVYIGLLTFPLSAMGMILALYQRARTAIERIGDIDRAAPEGAVAGGDPEATAAADGELKATAAAEGELKATAPTQLELKARHAGTQKSAAPLLQVEKLNFCYPVPAGKAPSKVPAVLTDISFNLERGQRLGLFGPIGAGKSTLFNVLTRLVDPPAATVRLNGTDVLNMEPRAVRLKLGYALQQVHLFSASIGDNLGFGCEPAPTPEALRAAAAGAQILDEVLAFEHGFATEIGEKGLRLSGGQKQRLALARLFIRRPEVLLLDDVLSAVDHATERRLLDYIYSLGCAMIIASHRGSALRRCDEILILNQGRIVDRGSFTELVQRFPELGRDV